MQAQKYNLWHLSQNLIRGTDAKWSKERVIQFRKCPVRTVVQIFFKHRLTVNEHNYNKILGVQNAWVYFQKP